MALERNMGAWTLEGHELQDGEQVEIYDAGLAGWRPAVVVCGASAVECQGTSDPDGGHHSADPGQNVTLEHIAKTGRRLRRVDVGAAARETS